MPIKPENRHRYPPDWPAIRERILTRAGNRCEHPGCTAQQYAWGKWIRMTGDTEVWRFIEWGHSDNYGASRQLAAEQWFSQGEEGVRPTVIVLTIAHLDHQPEHCADSNLRAMCQRHHLAHDHDHHRPSAKQIETLDTIWERATKRG